VPRSFVLGNLLRSVNGRTDIARELVTMLVEETPRRLARLRQHLEAGDFEALMREAHTAKGSCLTVGAMRLGEIADALQSCTADQAATARRLVEAFEAELETVRGEIETAIARGDLGA
jgi:HPt (histidine-containing phosphotransfer) domain-containing protein